jgi:hypothetical protein
MSDDKIDQDTPASPDPAPAKAHGDALLDQSGSRQGPPPEKTGTEESEGD